MRHEAGTNSRTGLQTRAFPHRVPPVANRSLRRLTATTGNEFGLGWAIGRAFAPNVGVRLLSECVNEEFWKRC
jgi:hypothetical protein